MVEPRHVHLDDAKHVMKYLKGTLDCGLGYHGDHDFRLSDYINSYWVEVSLMERPLQDVVSVWGQP